MQLVTGKRRGFVVEGNRQELRSISNLPGSVYRKSEGVVRFPESVWSWKTLRDIDFDDISERAQETLERIRREYLEHRRKIRNAKRRFKISGETDLPVPLKLIPYSHQVQAYGFCSAIDSSALFMDQGTGKTLVALALAGGFSRIVVICPKSVKSVWINELEKHAKYKWSASMDSPPKSEGNQFWITNYDRIKREQRRLIKWKPDLLILDESHKIKNRKADRTKAATAIGRKVKHKLIMTGTPIGKCISEVWSQFNFLNPSVFGTFSNFKDRYLKMGGYMGYKVVGYKNQDEFADKLHSISFRVTKDECLDLPPISYQHLYIEADRETKRIYREMDLDLFTEIGNDEISVEQQASKMMKLRQIVGGMVRSDDDTLAKVSEKKLSALKDFLEDRVDKTVIFFSFTHEIELVKEYCEKAGIGYLILDGRTPQSDRDLFEERFNNDPKILVALIQANTGGEGLTLVSADVSIFYSPTFSFISYSQARDRIYRIGQQKPVTILFLVMKETVDERVISVLESNRQLIDQYLEIKRDYTLGDNIMAKSKTEKFTAADLANEFGITPPELRKHLRNMGATKPEGGWNWSSSKAKDLSPIRKGLKEALAGGKKTATKGKTTTTKKKTAKKTASKKTRVRRKKAAAK